MFARQLRKLREAKGMSQTGLAKKAGITQAYIASLETGVRRNPSLELVKKLAKILRTDVANLIK